MKAHSFFLVLIAGFITGCAPTPLKGRADRLDFLADGTTTRPELLRHLGQPSGWFEKRNQGYHVVDRERQHEACAFLQAKSNPPQP
jgi:hypothetical protein